MGGVCQWVGADVGEACLWAGLASILRYRWAWHQVPSVGGKVGVARCGRGQAHPQDPSSGRSVGGGGSVEQRTRPHTTTPTHTHTPTL